MPSSSAGRHDLAASELLRALPHHATFDQAAGPVPWRCRVNVGLADLPYMRRLLTRFKREPRNHNFLDVSVAEDGMSSLDEHTAMLRFNEDLRLLEVRQLLQSSSPVLLPQRSLAVSDAETAQNLQSTLHAIANRTLSLSIGKCDATQ